MYKNRTILTLILSSVVMIISIATLIFFFKIIANKNEHTSAVLLNLSNKMAKKNNFESVKNKIDKVKQTEDTINSYFVDSAKIDSFISYLEELGTNFNTEVKVESFENSPADKNTLLVRISCKGTFSDILNTILLLENTPYQIHITKTSLTQQQQTNTIVDKNGKSITTSIPSWQATISFNILIS